jgi:hypothetical protein
MQHSAPPVPGGFHEHRDETRHWVDQPPPGEVYIKDRHHVQAVRAIRDVSVRGVSLFVHDALMPGEPVVIQLYRGAEQVEFYAYVCWCRCEEPADSDWQQPPGDPCSDHCVQHVAGLRVYGPQSLSRLIAADVMARSPSRASPSL